jgi:septal ring factor EnvC (AmiA/AmiB activator)
MRTPTRLRPARALARPSATACVLLLVVLAPSFAASALEPDEQRLEAARAQAADVATKIDAAQAERAELEAQIARAEDDIASLHARLDDLRARVRRRAAWLYVRVSTPRLDAVMATATAIDAARAAHLAASAGDRDESVASQLQATARGLEDRQTQLRARRGDLEDVIASLVSMRAELDARIQRAVVAARRVVRDSGGATYAAPSSFTSDAVWLAFRECTFAHESGGNYQIVSPDGLYYGAWQFAIPTWNAVAGRMGRGDLVGVLPSLASPADQDAVAHQLWLERGNQPWGGRC